MRRRVADYIADYLVEHEIKDVFTVVGGGAMHLNDAFGQAEGLRCTYNHHEQASTIAAEGYARIHDKMAVACVTTGPGGTNALTGVLCAWQDGIPILVISGQVRTNTTVESTGLDLRQFGEQEYYIIRSVKPMTKYAIMVKDPNTIRYHLEKAFYLANDGRKGPCWLDIPLDVQNAVIETAELEGFTPPKIYGTPCRIEEVLELLREARKPVILAGSAIRSSGGYEKFRKLIDQLNIPVVCATSIADLFPNDHEKYFGNFGVFGGRAGNFIVQNSDLIISLGCRLSFKQIGFHYEKFAISAKKVVVDVDLNELKKATMKIDLPICVNIIDFMDQLEKNCEKVPKNYSEWMEYCNMLKESFPISGEKYKESHYVNPYYFAEMLKKVMPDRGKIVVGNSCACVSLLQAGVVKEGQRIWGNVNCGTMGYDLPAAIGASRAANDMIICATGDGSIQMNLQELQTIVHNELPIKIIVFNNGGYQAIVQTQRNFFGRYSGCTENSGISFPSFEKIAYAYHIPYYKIENHDGLEEILNKFLSSSGYALCEVIQDQSQPIEPKVQSKMLEDGTLMSPPIDDLAPFLKEEEYKKYKMI